MIKRIFGWSRDVGTKTEAGDEFPVSGYWVPLGIPGQVMRFARGRVMPIYDGDDDTIWVFVSP